MRLQWNNRTRLLLTIVVFSVVGGFLVRNSWGVDSLLWCNIYAVHDFDSFEKTADFVANLRIPIPIALALAEIASYNLTSNTHLITHVCYRVAMVLSFVLAIYLASSSKRKMLASLALSVVFLWSTVLIHPGNAQTYDIFLPFFSLLFIVFLKLAAARVGSSDSSKAATFYCLASGFSLSMAELMRPFVFLLLPVLLFCTYQTLKAFPIRYYLYFLAPLVLFSGTWHVHMAVRHGQSTWSNQSGFNLFRAWPIADMPTLVPEPNNQPVRPLRCRNLNTAEHYENNQRIQKAVLQYMLKHPAESLERVNYQMGALLFGKTQMFDHRPESPLFWVYRPFVWLACVALFTSAAMLCIGIGQYRWAVLGVPENILIVMAVSYIFVFAIGESGEQARFLLSVLPLIAALPVARAPTAAGAEATVAIRLASRPLPTSPWPQ